MSLGDVMRYARWVAVLTVLAGLLYFGWYEFRRAVRVPFAYSVEARFASVPPDDRALADWIKAQPGVIGMVGIGRLGDGRVVVQFSQSKNLLYDPAFPRLDEAAASFGYQGGSPFQDTSGETPALPAY